MLIVLQLKSTTVAAGCLLVLLTAWSANAQTAEPFDPVGFRGGDPLFTDLFAPSDAVGPFADLFWTRGDAGTSFAVWENFNSAIGPNEPAIRENVTVIPTISGPVELVTGTPGTPLPQLPGDGEATVTFVPFFDPPIVTSTLNLYSAGGAGRVELQSDAEDLGVNYDTRVVLQVGSLGSEQDTDSFQLEFVAPNGELVSLPPIEAGRLGELSDSGSEMGGVAEQTFAVWTIPRFNPDEFTIAYEASGNLSTSTLILDVFTQPAVVGDFTGDRLVDQADFDAFQAGFGSDAFTPDANLDGFVNAADFVILRDSVSAPLLSSAAVAVAVVPEPRSVASLLIAMVCVAGCSRLPSPFVRHRPRSNV